MNKQAKYKNGQLVGRGIEWTLCSLLSKPSQFASAIWFIMNLGMASFAKCKTVRYFKAQFGVKCKRLDMMSIKVSPSIVSAMLAGEFIACKNIISPLQIFIGKSQASALCAFSILVTCVARTTRGIKSNCNTYFLSIAQGARESFLWTWLTLSGPAHLTFGFLCVFLPLECGYTAFSICWIFYVATGKAFGVQTVTSRSVITKLASFFPSAARIAPFQSGFYLGQIIFKGQSNPLGGYL